MTSPADLEKMMPFATQLGIKIESATKDEVVGSLPWRAELCTTGGIMHGGAIMAFADTLGAVVAFLNLPPGAGTATIESKTNMFRAVPKGVLKATSTTLHVGRTTIVVQTDLRNEENKRVALVTQTQAVISK